ncbi:MAG: PD40 domain-containing protein [Bdellovibrionaceae bacterium]|nr:PD40 domain-containing protein [Pseudobdellovibrionaceae bacterium]
MHRTKWFFLFFALLFPFISSAQTDPSAKWAMLDDEHAIWVYDSRHKDLAYQYAKNFRRIFPDLQKLFREFPDKTTFVIVDQTDMPNGSATVFPYPLITIFPVLPLPNSPIGETDDSLYEILVHEYTHILNLDPVHGAMVPLSWIFGSIIHPNAYLPRWYSEGLAVYTETYFMARGGRLRSQNFEGMVRAFSLSDSWKNYEIDQLNDYQPDWLGGRRAYLMGGAIFNELVQEKSPEAIYTLNERYARRVPYFLNGPLEDEIQKSHSELLSSTYQRLSELAKAQMATIQNAPTSRGQVLPHQGQENFYPVYSPDAHYMAYITRNHNVPSAVMLKDNRSDQQDPMPQQVFMGLDILHLAWSPDSKTLAFNSVEPFKRFYTYSDIHLYDVTTQKVTRLTQGGRSGSMAFSEDGKKIIFAQNIPGAKRITELSINNKQLRVLYDPKKIGTNIFALHRFKGQLAFIEQFLNQRTLKLLNLETLKVKTLNDNIAVSRMRQTPKGLLFSSSQSGVENLYLVDEINDSSDLSKAKPLTNSLTRIMDGDINPVNGELIYSEQDADGLKLKKIGQEGWQKITSVPHVEPLIQLPKPPPLEEANIEGPFQERSYSPWHYMWPRYWMPFGYVLDGGFGLQASTGASDPVNYNSYNLVAEWDSLTKKTGGTATYSNRSTPVEIVASASQVYRYSYTSQTTSKNNNYSLGGNYNVPLLFRNWDIGLSWNHSETEFTSSFLRRSGPMLVVGYNSAIRRGYEISPESGSTLSLSHQSYFKNLGTIGYDKTSLNFRHYFSPSWFPDRHVFFTQLNGTYAPKLHTASLYTSTLNGSFVSNLLIPPFLLRGYPSGNILGNNLLVTNLEYRFPIAYVYRGVGTLPVFVKTIHGAVIGDAISLDGYRYSVAVDNYVKETFGKHVYGGYGLELHIETTIGYYLPVTFNFGIFRGANRDLTTQKTSYFFAFQF